MRANISEQELADIIHQLMAAKGFAVAAIKEAGRLSSKENPVDLRRIRADALTMYELHLQTAPDSESRGAASKTGEEALDQIIAMVEAMGAKPH